ncbi:MAG: hypothetical protein EBX37_04710 [Alphaproteobacteria bacterium]|nr:hypothetical protein [Alphaproteobacteria bacterium]
MTDYLINYSAAEAVTLADGKTWRGPNCEGSAARHLLADGLPPDTRLVFCRDGKPALRGGIVTFAGRMWAGAKYDPAFQPYHSHPRQDATSSTNRAAENRVGGAAGSHLAGDVEAALAEGGVV